MATATATATLRPAIAARLADDAEVRGSGTDRSVLRRAVARALAAEGVVAPPEVWAQLVRDLVDELAGLGPLETLLRDPTVTEVMVNGAGAVHVERAGRLERTDRTFSSDDELVRVVTRILAPLGVRLDRSHPYADAVLAGGLRLHVILPPLAERPTVTLRRVPAVVPTWDELATSGSVPPEAGELLVELVRARRNVAVCGRAGAGKTTLLARLLAEVGDDRVIVIEDAPELTHPARHTVHLRTRAATADGIGEVSVAMLVRNAMRMRPDRIVIGEVRGAEVVDLLQAMNTGHAGSMTSVHANGVDEAVVRLEGMALLAGIPPAAARSQVAAGIDALVALDRARDGRRILTGIASVDAERGRTVTGLLWRP
jgi:pilus assembly protein CpaF